MSGTWIDINEDVPVIAEGSHFGETLIVRVTCSTWQNPKTMVMDYVEKPKRGTDNHWKWNNTYNTENWIVTHWMELPSPDLA